MDGPAYVGKSVLVTGGAGVIGRELVTALADQGAKVLVADLKPQPDWLPDGVEYVEGDAIDLTADQIAALAPEYCFHLAATFERTEETPEFWEENFHHNVWVSHHIATLLKDCASMKRMVFASSYLIYEPELYLFDSAQESPKSLTEDLATSPRNLCGAAKRMHEQELEFLSLFEGTPFTSVYARIFRVYGRGSKDIVSRWVRSLVNEPSEKLTVYRPEGIFDYIYAGDVADGLLRIGVTDATGPVNIGSGNSRSVNELLNVLWNRFPEIKWGEEDSDIPFEAHQADLARLKDLTGWQPPTSLEEGVGILVEHEREAAGQDATPA